MHKQNTSSFLFLCAQLSSPAFSSAITPPVHNNTTTFAQQNADSNIEF